MIKEDMEHNLLATLTHLPDAELMARVKTLITREREAGAELIAHLAELDTRDLHLRQGYASLYVYCRDALGLSEWEAYNRIEVARAARRFPVILEMLAEGSVNLTSVRLLAPHLTPDNHRAVLESSRGKRKQEVEEMVARLAPRPDARAFVRRLPPRANPGAAAGSVPITESAAAPIQPLVPAAMGVAPDPTPVPPAPVTPLSPDRYKLQLTISGETLEKLRLAKDMLGHSLPSGDDAAIVDRALTVLLVDLAKKRFADTSKPRRSSGRKSGARTPSAAVKRAVWLRDRGRCAFVATSGHRCGERRFVEFHHVDPYALGGEATVHGIELRCRRHNDYEGRLYFGERRPRRELVPEQVRLGPACSTEGSAISE
jgi:hypothetical protein